MLVKELKNLSETNLEENASLRSQSKDVLSHFKIIIVYISESRNGGTRRQILSKIYMSEMGVAW